MSNGILTVSGSLPAIIRNDAGLYEGDLKYYYQVVFRHAQNLNNPYHNFRHIFHVLWLCHDACDAYQRHGEVLFLDGERILRSWDWRKLLIAAMFHDFNHLGRAVPDSFNIQMAVTALERHIDPADRTHLEEIQTLIRMTEFPYVFPSEELSLFGQILRDADAAQALDPAWIQQVIFGLAEEWGKNPLEVLKMQESFLGNIKFATEWAQKKFTPELVKAKITETKELLELLG